MISDDDSTSDVSLKRLETELREGRFPTLAEAARAIRDDAPIRSRVTIVVLRNPIDVWLEQGWTTVPRGSALIGPVLFTAMVRGDDTHRLWDDSRAPLLTQFFDDDDSLMATPIVRGDYFERTSEIAIIAELILAPNTNFAGNRTEGNDR